MSPQQSPQQSNKHILIIDDEDDIREVAQVSLELMAGWQISTAASSAEGITQAKAQQPDAILLDVMLPDIDGPTTFRMLQNDPETRHIPVILLTAKVQATDQRQFADLGVAAVIAKPFDPVLLADQVARYLGWEPPTHA
ncbi:response regulator [Trichothermofontia sichuanensis B231]|uniref:response regulator n=1 Tax=Trichothermofontia sichuanensis TaxID=3045816 RepID=UPI00224760E0|nr:response regulator [Trichothermofontia sichuanensis]UZQ53753.1 response regulator [Trichothermofontia sichuanensis B231]